MIPLIVEADDLGLSKAFNAGIAEAARDGFVTSTCARVNGSAFSEGLELLGEFPHLGRGVHLNIVEGKTTRGNLSKTSLLCHSDGTYRLGFVGLFRGRTNPALLSEIEADYRDQIETFACFHKIDHLNSHQHSHAIPEIFDLVCRLAREYQVPYIRLAREKFHLGPYSQEKVRPWYGSNLAKTAILNALALRNRGVASRAGVKTNAWFVGISHTGFMNPDRIQAGLGALPDQTGIVEMLLHPARIQAVKGEVYLDELVRDYVIRPGRGVETETLTDRELYRWLSGRGFRLTNYRELEAQEKSADFGRPVAETVAATMSGAASRPQGRLKAFLIIDETPFHHPEYVRRIIQECRELDVRGVAIVALPNGGVLKAYLLKNWVYLGLRELLLLGLKQTALKLAGALPRTLRGDFDSSVRAVAKRFGIPYRVVSKVNTEDFVSYVRGFEPEVILSSNSLIFGERLIQAAKVACINRHSAVLPACGGILPVFRAIQQGAPFTGATVHVVTKDVDRGPVLSRQWLPIFRGDTLNRLYRFCFVLSYEATVAAARKLLVGLQDGPDDPDLGKITPSYFSYPRPEDWAEFRANGGRFI